MTQLSLKNRLAQRLLSSVRPAFFASYLKKLFGIERTVVETEFGRFYVDPVSILGRELTSKGKYEPSMIQTLKEHLSESGTFVEIGSNEGFFSVIAAEIVGSTGTVLAAEPQERLQSVIEKNLSLNSIRNADVHRLAISDHDAMETLHLTPNVNSGSSGLKRATQYWYDTENVPTTTLKKFLDRAGIDHVDVMKIDIEGLEYEAVMGSRSVFENRRVSTIALELHPSRLQERGLTMGEIVDFIEGCGYRLDDRFRNTVWTSEGGRVSEL